jgi:aldehyde dehydrogenase family protein
MPDGVVSNYTDDSRKAPPGNARATIAVEHIYSAAMPSLFRPLQLLVMMFSGWVNRHQLDVIDYLQEENRLLKERLGGRRIRFTDAERRRLARKAHALGRKVLNELETLVTPDTLLRWHRELVAAQPCDRAISAGASATASRWDAQLLSSRGCLSGVDPLLGHYGFGLTLGVHTRLESMAHHVFRSTSAGNVYVNRNMIGAAVGVQPFGGQKLSGTGPKAGGPHYLLRFVAERTLTINTAAAGGNVELMA